MALDPKQLETWRRRFDDLGRDPPPPVGDDRGHDGKSPAIERWLQDEERRRMALLSQALPALLDEVERLAREATESLRVSFAGPVDAAAKAENDRLRALLREVEFKGIDGTCPLCGADYPKPGGNRYAGTHTPYCRLAAELNG